MKATEWCGRCHAWHRVGEHKPMWAVACIDDGEDLDDVRPVYADDAEEAAETWAERDDSESAEYRVVSGHDVTVAVRLAAGGEVTHWRVSGEAVPSYSAHKVAR